MRTIFKDTFIKRYLTEDILDCSQFACIRIRICKNYIVLIFIFAFLVWIFIHFNIY